MVAVECCGMLKGKVGPGFTRDSDIKYVLAGRTMILHSILLSKCLESNRVFCAFL
jgi:hypothetical protein